MREYKFRAWHKLEKKYYDVWSIDFINETVTLKTTTMKLGSKWVDKKIVKFSDVILEQYTGLKDKNGKDIYLGDIVYYGRDEESFEIGYDDKIGAIDICNGGVCYTFDNLYGKDLEIIRNINENKEWLDE